MVEVPLRVALMGFKGARYDFDKNIDIKLIPILVAIVFTLGSRCARACMPLRYSLILFL